MVLMVSSQCCFPLDFSLIVLNQLEGEYPVAYIDALFLTYSAMTVTGLSTVNLSTTTPFQQAILFFLMLLGDVVRGVLRSYHDNVLSLVIQTMVALIVVLVRKWCLR